MTTRLMQSLDFTEEDLEYNRKGALSPRQSARLTRKRRALKLFLLLLGILLACVGGGILAGLGGLSFYKGEAAGIQFLIAAGVLALFGAPLIFLGLKPMRSIKVAAAKGTASVARVQRTQRINNVTSTFVATELHLADKIFTVPDEAFPELVDGASYAVYYWDGLTDIFSLEKL